MLNLIPIETGDKDLIYGLLKDNPTRICETTYGVMVIWNVGGEGLYCYDDGTLFLAAENEKSVCFNFPIGGDEEKALEKIREYCLAKGKKLRFCFLSEGQKGVVEGYFGVKCGADRDWEDYVYLTSELLELSGKKFHGQKNHLNQFLKKYPKYEFLPYDEKMKGAALKFAERYYEGEQSDGIIFNDEKDVFLHLIEHFEGSRQNGAALFVDGEMVALTFGETAGDTFYVHFEKALRDYIGSYAAVNNFFLREYGENTTYVNREEDIGDEGLRTAKLALHPVMMVKKYFAEADL